MPSYRLIFPAPTESAIEETKTVLIDSGDTIYETGDELEYGGKLWKVSQAPVEQPKLGQTEDLMIWPAEAS